MERAFRCLCRARPHLYNFLQNKDPNDFQARDSVDNIRYKATRSEAAISTFQKLRDQVLHLGKGRPINDPQKAQLGECEVISRWIEQNLLRFIEVLEEPYASKCTWPVLTHKADYSGLLHGDLITQTGTPPVIL